jgi:hypothetical protein
LKTPLYKIRALDDSEVHDHLNVGSKKLNAMCGAASAAARFVSMSKGWYGPKLVRDRISGAGAGVVMAVLRTCFITTSLQMCMLLFITPEKGKFDMVTLC